MRPDVRRWQVNFFAPVSRMNHRMSGSVVAPVQGGAEDQRMAFAAFCYCSGIRCRGLALFPPPAGWMACVADQNAAEQHIDPVASTALVAFAAATLSIVAPSLDDQFGVSVPRRPPAVLMSSIACGATFTSATPMNEQAGRRWR